MMINAWKLHGEATRTPAWSNLSGKKDIYSKGFSVTKSAPYGVDDAPTQYSTSLRPQTSVNEYTVKAMPSAGSSSW